MHSRYSNGLRMSRRDVLRSALAGAGLLIARRSFGDVGGSTNGSSSHVLGDADANGIKLLPGFSSRVVARSGSVVTPGSTYRWHGSPDGGACFATADGGWVYVSNSELPGGHGGVGALRFDAQGAVVGAYPILSGTSLNCAGGATPWGTWLSCEEFPDGRVWECDPLGAAAAVVHPALGVFKHEAATIDPVARCVYLTEDAPNARLYRFTPAEAAAPGGDRLDLSSGILDVAEVVGGSEGAVHWHTVPDPSGASAPTASQVRGSTNFPGSEGMIWNKGIVYFTTKYDNRVWAYDTNAETIRILYDDDRYTDPILTGVDNVVVAPAGEVLVAEDGGDMQIVAITSAGEVYAMLQVMRQLGSEITGPAFDPSGTRLYFSSQRGPRGLMNEGITYEVTGPFAQLG